MTLDLDSTLATLGLSPEEASSLLDVSDRTFRRWREDSIPATAEAALRAWLTLQEWGIPWRPDTVSVVEDDRDQIRRARAYAVEVDEMLKRVAARGGPRDPWTVDFRKSVAFFDTYRVAFYTLANGGFSLSTYSRRDERPDARRDAERIEDAAYWIADGYRRSSAKADAIRAVAKNVRENPTYAQWGPVHSPKEREEHLTAIKAVADRMDELSVAVAEKDRARGDFHALLTRLHDLGVFPDSELVSAVARAFMREE